MESTFIHFLKNKDHLIDDIVNGFPLRKHKINFQPSVYKNLPLLIEFWKNKKISNKLIDPLISNYEKLDEQNFWKWFGNEMSSDQGYNFNISYIFAQIGTAEINMKCFTELRDNQKLHPNHEYYFGKYGIAMSKEWMLKNGADRIIYVDSHSEVTNRIALLLSMLLSTLDGKDALKAMFDVLSFTEISGNSHEFEWRIVGNHHFAGKSHGNYPDIIPFTTDDIESIFVTNDDEVNDFVQLLQQKKDADGSKKIPQVYKSESIFLTDDEIAQIENIKSRR